MTVFFNALTFLPALICILKILSLLICTIKLKKKKKREKPFYHIWKSNQIAIKCNQSFDEVIKIVTLLHNF